jgi:hypothetical protein
VQSVDEQQKLIRECFSLVSKRSDLMCNFVEGGDQWGSDTKLIYRHYATLYFVFCVDSSESELGILDLIHIFVEALDKSFENVCELDLIFHADKVRARVTPGLLCRALSCTHFCFSLSLSVRAHVPRARACVACFTHSAARLLTRQPLHACTQVHHILDELVMGGMVLETNLPLITGAVDDQNKLEKAEAPLKQGIKDAMSKKIFT